MTPAIVDDEYPPSPFVTIHSVSISTPARASRSAGSSRRRTILSSRRLGMRRREEDGTLGRNPPTVVGLERRRSPATVLRRIRREDCLPRPTMWWCDEWFGKWIGVETRAEIHN